MAGIVSTAGAAAPFVGPSRAEVLRILSQRNAEKKMPIVVGKYEPQAVIEHKNGKWQLCLLQRTAEGAKAKPDASGNFVPEMTWSELKPSAPTIQEADKKKFIQRLSALKWTFSD